MRSSARLVMLGFTLLLAMIYAGLLSAEFSGLLEELPMPVFMAVTGVTSLLQLTLAAVYAILLSQLPALSVEAKLVWLLAILFTGPAGMLCYWFIHVRQSPSKRLSSCE